MSKVMFFMVLSVFMFLSSLAGADEVALLEAKVAVLKEQVESLEKQMGLVIAILEHDENNREEAERKAEQMEREAQEDKAAVERGMQEIEAWDEQATADRQGRRWRAGWDFDWCDSDNYDFLKRECGKGDNWACGRIAHCK